MASYRQAKMVRWEHFSRAPQPFCSDCGTYAGAKYTFLSRAGETFSAGFSDDGKVWFVAHGPESELVEGTGFFEADTYVLPWVVDDDVAAWMHLVVSVAAGVFQWAVEARRVGGEPDVG